MTDTAEIIARAVDPWPWDEFNCTEPRAGTDRNMSIAKAETVISALTEAGLVIVPKERLHDLQINLLGAMEDYGDDASRLTIARVAGQLRSLERSGDCAQTLHLAKEKSQ